MTPALPLGSALETRVLISALRDYLAVAAAYEADIDDPGWMAVHVAKKKAAVDLLARATTIQFHMAAEVTLPQDPPAGQPAQEPSV